jgi:hypothetical protein
MELARLVLLLVSLRWVCALEKTWREDHSVAGLPMIGDSEVTSYAGLVTVRKDNGTEVISKVIHLTNRADCSTGYSKLNNRKRHIHR